jgi:integrase
LARFEAYWPRGTRERVLFDILAYTGLRIGDVATLGRQHLKQRNCKKTGKVGKAEGQSRLLMISALAMLAQFNMVPIAKHSPVLPSAGFCLWKRPSTEAASNFKCTLVFGADLD